MLLSGIVAMANHGVIGYQNQMPWHLPADLRHFRDITMGKPIIMGRKTYVALGKPLPGRQNIVLTRTHFAAPKEVVVVNSLADALEKVAQLPDVFIIGGQQIFENALSDIQRLYITYIDHDFPGDTWFPIINVKEWKEISCEYHDSDEKNPYTYRFVTLERK